MGNSSLTDVCVGHGFVDRCLADVKMNEGKVKKRNI